MTVGEPPEQSGRQWTVMVFMAVDEATAPFAVRDLREIEKAGSSAEVDVVAQIHWKDGGVDRYHINSEITPLAKREAGSSVRDPGTLDAFLADALRLYPAKHYALILWGHSYGFGFGRSEANRLPLSELVDVLRAFEARRNGTMLEILAWDTCRMAKVEAVYELRTAVRYLIASQVGVPFTGWPFRIVLQALTARPSMTPRELGQLIVNRYCEWFRNLTVTMTMFDLAQSDTFLDDLKPLASAVCDELAASSGWLETLHDAFVAARCDVFEPLVDVETLCTKLEESHSSDALKAAAARLRSRLESKDFIVSFERLGPLFDSLHGISMYAPHVATAMDWPVFNITPETYKALGLDDSLMWKQLAPRLQKMMENSPIQGDVVRSEPEARGSGAARAG